MRPRSGGGTAARSALVPVRLTPDVDALAPVAMVTQHLPGGLGAKIGWHLGERAPRTERVARLRGGGRVVVDVGDYVHRLMYFLGEYESSTTRLFKLLATPGWTVLDVGANAGYFSVVAGIAGGPGSRVVAFEPNPRLTRMLARSIALNPRLDIRLERVAIGDEPGELPFHLTSVTRNSGLSSLRSDLPDTAGEVISVPVETIDGYCEKHSLAPDLIKIDVEGFELQALLGAAKTLRDRRPGAVICEVEPTREDPSRIVDLMRAHGYAAHSIARNGQLGPLALDPSGTFENVCFTPLAG